LAETLLAVRRSAIVLLDPNTSIDRAIAKLKKMSDDASGLRVDAQATSST